MREMWLTEQVFGFMPILLFTLLFSACLGGDFDSRIDQNRKVVTPIPTPTTEADIKKKECVASCQDACGAWGKWSDLSPATDTVCKGQKLTQSQSRTRTCKATCPEVTCDKDEDKEIEVDGTKDCTAPPPPCQTSCTTGCQDKAYGDWSPKAADRCKNKDPFTQSRDWTRACFPTCNAKAECLCTGITCDKGGSENKEGVKGTKEIDCDQACDKDADEITWGEEWLPKIQAEAAICKGETVKQTRTGTFTCPRDNCKQCKTTTDDSRTLVGTKVTACQADNSPYCDAWQPALSDCVWTPAIDLSTKYKDETFTLTCTQTRTCPRACPGSTCRVENNSTRTVTGKKDRVAAVTSAPDPDPPAPTCKSSCSAGCDAVWGSWSAWVSSDSCPSPSDYFGVQQEPKEITETRNRTRKCENLCTGVECFTSNNETRITPCTFCTGANQAIEADGTCDCDRSGTIKYYRVGDECQACELPNTLVESGGTYTCKAPPECAPTSWEVEGVYINAIKVCDEFDTACKSNLSSGVCTGFAVTPTIKSIRECNNCTAADSCEPTKTEPVAEEDKVQGTKTTPCQTFCKWEDDWGNWTTTNTCPAGSKTSRTRYTIQGLEKKKLISCNANLCPNSGCTDQTRPAQRYCPYCEGDGMIKKNAGTASEECVCNEGDRYYPDGDSCTQCPRDKEFEQVSGVWQCNAKQEPELKSGVVIPEPPEPTCTDVCKNDWSGWSDWEHGAYKCPSNKASMSKPEKAQQLEVRSRSRTCSDATAAAELGCFTSNQETRLERCDYCLGTGMKKENEGTASEKCVCNSDDGYYEEEGVCVQCGVGEILNASKDGCICDEDNNYYLKDGECVLCNQPHRELVGGSCNCIDGYEEVTQADGSVVCEQKTIVVTCDLPKKLKDGKCECDSDSGYITDPADSDGCICNASSGYYYDSDKEICVLCKAPKKLKDGECKEEAEEKVAAAPSYVAAKKADNCKAGCGDWGKWSSLSTPSGGANCPSANAFDPPPANTDKQRTRSRTCNNLEAGVECFTTNTETQKCRWCQGMGQIFDDDGDCVCDVSNNFYKDNKDNPPSCKTCVAGKTPDKTGDGCICSDTECENDKKDWDSDNCKCGACKPDIVAACSYGHDESTCECNPEPMVEPESEPEAQPEAAEITLTLYHGCYLQQDKPLYMPTSADTDLLGKNHKWKLELCFNNNKSSYENAANTLNDVDSTSKEVTPIIQKLYKCAKDNSKQNFIKNLTNNSEDLCPPAAGSTYTVTITP